VFNLWVASFWALNCGLQVLGVITGVLHGLGVKPEDMNAAERVLWNPEKADVAPMHIARGHWYTVSVCSITPKSWMGQMFLEGEPLL